jgi:hypothetical protein
VRRDISAQWPRLRPDGLDIRGSTASEGKHKPNAERHNASAIHRYVLQHSV